MTRPLWTSDAAAEATGGELTGGPWAATGISIDTRTLEPGDLFVAIEGLARDGHEFITAAEEAGAAAVLVSRPGEARGPCLVVEDTLEGLNALAGAARARTKAKVAAVTGSVGKTSTKEACARRFNLRARSTPRSSATTISGACHFLSLECLRIPTMASLKSA